MLVFMHSCNYSALFAIIIIIMSDLTVDTVKAMPCQALRGQFSQCGLNPKGN